MPSPATHLRAPLLWLLVPLMAGLIAAKLWPAPAFGLWPLSLLAVLAAIGGAWAALRPGFPAGFAWGTGLCLSAGLGGFVMLQVRHPALHERDSRPPREVTVTLRVLQTFPAAPDARNLTGLGVVSSAGDQDRELLGRRVYYSAIRRISVPPQRSGAYVIRGVLEPLSAGATNAGFNDYLANLGIHQRLTRAHILRESVSPDWLQRFYTRTEDRLEGILRHGLEAQPQTTSIYLAMLLGEKAVLSTDQQNAYMRSGTFHLFSISGLHVAAIAGAIYLLFRLLRVSRGFAVVIGLIVLWLYVEITGGSSPAERSFLMIAFLSVYQAFRLPGNALAALVVAALVTLLLDPLQLFSTGFQMSYTVVIALVTMGRPLTEKWLIAWRPFALLPRSDWRWYHRQVDAAGRILLNAAAACWTAFLASTPAGIGYFELLSPGSLLANLVIIPLSSIPLWAGFISLITGLAGLLPLSALSNAVAALIIALMDWLLQHGTNLPGMWFNARFRTEWLAPVSLGLMTAVFLAGAAGRWAPRYGGYWPPAAVLALLVFLGVKFG